MFGTDLSDGPLTPDQQQWCLDHLGGTPIHAAAVRDTARSTVVRWTTAGGVAWFKADHILPPPEAVVLERLSRIVAGAVVRPIALDVDRGWSLTHDAGPTGLDDATTEDWCTVARTFADVQRTASAHLEHWLAVGCLDRRGDRLRDALLDVVDRFGQELESAERPAIPLMKQRIEEACADLASDGLPATLVHQDVVPENLIVTKDGPVFLDWSDTVVGHPFFGIDRLLDFCWTDAPRKEAVIAAYLDRFEDLAPRERLERSFRRMMSLRVLYENLRWAREIDAAGPETDHALGLRADLLAGMSMMARHVL